MKSTAVNGCSSPRYARTNSFLVFSPRIFVRPSQFSAQNRSSKQYFLVERRSIRLFARSIPAGNTATSRHRYASAKPVSPRTAQSVTGQFRVNRSQRGKRLVSRGKKSENTGKLKSGTPTLRFFFFGGIFLKIRSFFAGNIFYALIFLLFKGYYIFEFVGGSIVRIRRDERLKKLIVNYRSSK